MAYVECAEKSWPAWGRKYPESEARLAAIMATLRQTVPPSAKIVLTGHSGGGAFLFRYLNSRCNEASDFRIGGKLGFGCLKAKKWSTPPRLGYWHLNSIEWISPSRPCDGQG